MVVLRRTLLDRGLGGEGGGEYFALVSMPCREGTEMERVLLFPANCVWSERRGAVGCLTTLDVL